MHGQERYYRTLVPWDIPSQNWGLVLHNMPLSILRHAGYKKNGVCSCFQWEVKRGTMWKISNLMLYFASVFIPTWGFVIGIFHSFSPSPSSNSGQSEAHRAGCCCGTLLVRIAYAWWTVGWSEPSSSHFPSLRLHLPHFTPKLRHSGVERPLQSSVCVFSTTRLHLLAILQNERVEEKAPFVSSFKPHFKEIVWHFRNMLICFLAERQTRRYILISCLYSKYEASRWLASYLKHRHGISVDLLI